MRREVISEKTQFPIGLSVIVIGGGAFWLSAVFSQLQTNTRAIEDMRAEVHSLYGMKTDIEVMRVKIEAMEKPVVHTQRDIQSLRKEVANLNFGPLVPFSRGPLTMRDR